MTPLFLFLSSVCIIMPQYTDKLTGQVITWNVPSAENYCYEKVRISSSPEIRQGEVYICERVGHEWEPGSTFRSAVIGRIEYTEYSQCRWCLKRRRKVTRESWEDVK